MNNNEVILEVDGNEIDISSVESLPQCDPYLGGSTYRLVVNKNVKIWVLMKSTLVRVLVFR